MACDYVYAKMDSKIAMNFIGIGLIPDGGGHYFMKKRLGEVKAKQLIWEGKSLSAEEATSIGLIDESFDINEVEKIEEIAAVLSRKPLKAMKTTKELYRKVEGDSLENVIMLETKLQGEMRRTYDHQEGIRAFVEKRRPNFKGE
ncbi:enoyl-CoA hydratase-related protein [Bacillus carboniphilus]|uniref:enoyl-CoA hydratase-related protein n=1 Tax=Bacillus carboniphilus TaxID=86663 RepID=UPI0035324E2A